jgi:ligand-binding sensor domain-containing protein
VNLVLKNILIIQKKEFVRKLLTVVVFLLHLGLLSGQFYTTKSIRDICAEPPDEIKCVARAQNGTMLLGTSQGVYSFDGKRAQQIPTLGKRRYLYIKALSSEVFGIISDSGLYVFNYRSQKTSFCPLPVIKSEFKYNNSFELGNGDSLFVVFHGQPSLCQFNGEKVRYVKELKRVAMYCVIRHTAQGTYIDEAIDTVRRREIYQIHGPKTKLGDIHSYFHSSEYKIIKPQLTDFITNEPVQFDFRVHQLSFDLYQRVFNFENSIKPPYLANSYLSSIVKDNVGYIWIVTNTEVYVSYPTAISAGCLFKNYSIRDILSLPDGRVIAAMADSLFILNSSGKVLQAYNVHCYGFLQYNEDSVFITSDEQLCGWLNIKKNKVTTFRPLPSTVFFHHGSISMGKGKLLIYGSGIFEFDVATGKIEHLILTNDLNINSFRSGLAYGPNFVYLAGSSGLYEYSRTQHRLNRISNEYILHLDLGPNNSIIAGTMGNGPYYFYPNSGTLKKINWPFGGTSDIIYSVKYENGELWAGTGNGLVNMNLSTGKYRFYSSQSGTGNKEYNTPGAQRITDSTLWFGALNGIVTLNTKAKFAHYSDHKPFITALRYFRNNWFSVQAIFEDNKIQFDLPQDINSAEIWFGCEDFALASEYSVQFRIKGKSSDWNLIAPYSGVALNNLQNGITILEFRLVDNRTGEAGETYESVIHVASYWYQEWWGKCVVGLSIVLFMLFALRLNSWIVKRKVFRENQLLKWEMKALTAQMDPHFIANLMSVAQHRVLKGKPDEAYEMLAEYGALMRKKFNTLQGEYTDLKSEVELLDNYIKVSAKVLDGAFNYDFIFDLSKPQKEYVLPTELIQPLVENVFKHAWKSEFTGLKTLTIQFKEVNNKLIVDVVDNCGCYESSSADHGRYSSYRNIEARLSLLSRIYKQELKLSIFSESGRTTARLLLNCNFVMHEKD